MTYELSKKANAWMKCPHCGGRCVKAGFAHHNNKPRAKCQECQKTFYTEVIKSDKILQSRVANQDTSNPDNKQQIQEAHPIKQGLKQIE